MGGNSIGDLKGVEAEEDHPVSSFEKKQLDLFLRRTGLSLPTEAQWDRALRAGVSTDSWWGDSLPEEAKKRLEKDRRMSPFGYSYHFSVGTKILHVEHPFGLLDTPTDMLQVCRDHWRSLEAIQSIQKKVGEEVDPIFTNGSEDYVLRGNLGYSTPGRNQTYRQPVGARYFDAYGIGFRLVKNL